MRSRNREALPRLEEAFALTQDAEARSEEGPIRNYLGSALAFLGDYPQAIDHLRASVRIARETRARARGVTSMAMDVLPGNHQVLAMVAGHWPAARVDHFPDCATIRVSLRPWGTRVYGRAAPALSAARSSVRDVIPSLGNTRYRCELTVRWDR